ncbi:MAG: hypothetical protein WC819_06205 [Parcubacteria group bacterium]|jgi:hypothetical protein
MSKISLVLIGVILLVTIGVFGFFFYSILGNKDSKGIGMKQEIIYPKMECDFESDSQAMSSALEKDDSKICGCSKDESFKNMCVMTVQESVIYKKAVMESKSELCDQIKNKEKIMICKDAVQGKIDFMKKNEK